MGTRTSNLHSSVPFRRRPLIRPTSGGSWSTMGIPKSSFVRRKLMAGGFFMGSTVIFFRGVETSNQPDICYWCFEHPSCVASSPVFKTASQSGPNQHTSPLTRVQRKRGVLGRGTAVIAWSTTNTTLLQPAEWLNRGMFLICWFQKRHVSTSWLKYLTWCISEVNSIVNHPQLGCMRVCP